MKKLTRSHDRMIGGVLGGIAYYYEIDPTVVRLGYVLFALLTCFSGILFYLIAWMIIPEGAQKCDSCETSQNKSSQTESHKQEKAVSQEKTNDHDMQKNSETSETLENLEKEKDLEESK